MLRRHYYFLIILFLIILFYSFSNELDFEDLLGLEESIFIKILIFISLFSFGVYLFVPEAIIDTGNLFFKETLALVGNSDKVVRISHFIRGTTAFATAIPILIGFCSFYFSEGVQSLMNEKLIKVTVHVSDQYEVPVPKKKVILIMCDSEGQPVIGQTLVDIYRDYYIGITDEFGNFSVEVKVPKETKQISHLFEEEMHAIISGKKNEQEQVQRFVYLIRNRSYTKMYFE